MEYWNAVSSVVVVTNNFSRETSLLVRLWTPLFEARAKNLKFLMLITSVRVKLIRTFIGQFLKRNRMGLIKIQNGGNYAHAQDSNAYNFC